MLQRFISIIFIFFTCLFSYADNEKWQVYLSYREPVQLEAAGTKLYVITKGSGTINSVSGNLLKYDTEDGSVKTYDCLNELNDKEICRISYNSDTDCLLILYSNGNVDLLYSNDEVINISSIKSHGIYGDNVRSISNRDDISYLCTEDLIIEIDTRNGIVVDTYKTFDKKVYSFVVCEGYYFIGTDTGLLKISTMSNLHDKSLWQTLISEEVYNDLLVYDSHIFGLKQDGVDEISVDASIRNVLKQAVSVFSVSDEKLLLGTANHIYIYEKSGSTNYIRVDKPSQAKDIVSINNVYYLAETSHGLFSYDLENSQFVNGKQVVSINSPCRDLFYDMHYVGNRLLISGGINTQTATYYPVTFMFMDSDGKWVNFDESQVSMSHPKLNNVNAVSLVQSPLDDRHFFGAVYRNGLHEYYMNDDGYMELMQLYDTANSPLRHIDVPVRDPWNYTTCTALKYDMNGNLWMANQQTDTIIRILRPNAKWVSLYYPEISMTTNVSQYLFSSSGLNFLVSYNGKPSGFFGFDTNGTLNTIIDDRFLLRSTITNQDATSVMPDMFYCMVEDLDGQIWCGTSEGLFVITNPENWFNSDFSFHQIKRNRDDDSGYADYLLAGVDITTIATDPSNRKWIGTLSDGVYLISPDGQETIYHFTNENSPLLSDRIHCIAINPHNGDVMFGTDLGLCSFSEGVTEPEQTLQVENIKLFPNPVHPNYNSMVTILGLTEGSELKIVNTAGQAVWGTKVIGGSTRWNCRNTYGEPVPSGVYNVIINTTDAKNTVIKRLVLIR